MTNTTITARDEAINAIFDAYLRGEIDALPVGDDFLARVGENIYCETADAEAVVAYDLADDEYACSACHARLDSTLLIPGTLAQRTHFAQ